MTKKCKMCNEPFEAKRERARFCPSCRAKRTLELRRLHYRKLKLHGPVKAEPPKRKSKRPLMMADIRRRAVPIVSGWRGRPCAGGFCPQVRNFYY